MATRSQRDHKMARRRHHAAQSRAKGAPARRKAQLEKFTVTELRGMASKFTDRGTSKMKKSELITIIVLGELVVPSPVR